MAAIYVETDEADGLAWGELLVQLDVSSQVIFSGDAANWDVSAAAMLLIGPDVDNIPSETATALVALGVPILGIGGGGASFYAEAGVDDLAFAAPSATSSVEIGMPEHPAFPAARFLDGEDVVVTTQPVLGWGIADRSPDVLAWDAEFGTRDFGLIVGTGHTYQWGLGDDGQGAALLTPEGVELAQHLMAWLIGVPGPAVPGDITGGD